MCAHVCVYASIIICMCVYVCVCYNTIRMISIRTHFWIVEYNTLIVEQITPNYELLIGYGSPTYTYVQLILRMLDWVMISIGIFSRPL